MAGPNVLLIRTAGTNCDEEAAFAFTKAGAAVHPVHVRTLAAKPATLAEHAILILPGGFSYGDDLGSGVVMANELVQRLQEPLARFVERGGLAIGICNGFQVLVKTGLLPGTSYRKDGELAATLTFNDSQRFEDRWVTLKVGKSSSPFLKGAEGKLVEFPVAHGEGKFVARSESVLSRIVKENQVAFTYVTRDGGKASYPANPNGAQADIAGFTDETGRVLGLMPHPERHVLPWQHPRWTRDGLKDDGDGMFLFRNAVAHAQQA